MSRYPEVRHLTKCANGQAVAEFDVDVNPNEWKRAYLLDVNGELVLSDFEASRDIRTRVLEDAKARYRAL